MPKEGGAATEAEMIVKRKDLMAKFVQENKDIVRAWEKLREDYEVAVFKKKYREKVDLWKDDLQLTLFP